MIHLVGGTLLFGSCLWAGVRVGARYREQEQTLSDAAEDLEELARRLDWNSPPLCELLERLSRRSSRLRGMYLRCARRLAAEDPPPVSVLWRLETDACAALPPDGKRVLTEAGELLGRYDRQTQSTGLRNAALELDRLARRAGEEYRQKGRVYRTVGGAAGLMLVILLL